jgi:hypothetical protein
MWIARNRTGDLRIFETEPRRFHEGPGLSSKLVGFNDEISVGDDEYSFWAVQEYCDSNLITDRIHFGLKIMTRGMEDGQEVFYMYEPDWARDITWEDKPVEVEITLKKSSNEDKEKNVWKPSERQLSAILTAIKDENEKGSDTVNELCEIYNQIKKI